MLVEVIACSPEEVVAVQEGGADRIELCCALEVGGLTPSKALSEMAIEGDVPVAVMVRPRTGGYQYSQGEIDFMCREISWFAERGADFIVVGASNPDDTLNLEAMKHFQDAATGTPMVCHRVFDQTPDLEKALEQLVQLGYRRTLTSGARKTAAEGADMIARLIKLAGKDIEIAPAAGIRYHNVQALIAATGVSQIHASVVAAMQPHTPKPVDFGPAPRVLAEEVRRFVQAAKGVSSHTDSK
ncbi:MAG: copper homeostasis protein CutC [Armatimonadota bacterium]